jgi:hypothetical protein
MNNVAIHPGHQRLREICCDTEHRRALVCEFVRLESAGLLTTGAVHGTIHRKQHFLASYETCAAIVEFIRQI